MMQKSIKEGLLLTFGSVLIALGIYFFKFPNNFATGGVSGLSVILGRIVRGISPGTFMLVINMALMVMGFFIVGRGFTGRSVYCSVVNSLTVRTLERVYPMGAPFTSQPLMELIFEILLTAVGSAILFNLDASTGGTDIVAMIIKKCSSLNIGTALLVSDAVIAASTIFIFGIETFLFCMLGLMMKGYVVDTVIDGMNLCKHFLSSPQSSAKYLIS